MEAAGWVVVIEGTLANVGGAVEEWRLRRLLEHMPGLMPIGLHCAERVAVQLHIEATDEVRALSVALSGLRAGLPKVGVRDLRVARAEVLTREEFDLDCRRAYGGGFTPSCNYCGGPIMNAESPDPSARRALRAVED